jgi:hypothetical protein
LNHSNRIEAAHRLALWTFALASLIAIALGSVAMLLGDVPLTIVIRNPIAWLLAGTIAIFLASRGWLGGWGAPVALGIIALSFLGPDQQGVHRWLNLGPIQLNAAALVLPLAIATFHRTHAALSAICFLLIAALLALQPDISQLAGFTPAAFILAAARFGWVGLGLAAAGGAAAITVCLMQSDPLAPVAHVEGIVAMAWSQSPLLALAMGLSLAVAAISPLAIWRARPSGVITPLALTAYFVPTALAPLFGAYPVPIAGYGVSFVVGWILGAAALTANPVRARV